MLTRDKCKENIFNVNNMLKNKLQLQISLIYQEVTWISFLL